MIDRPVLCTSEADKVRYPFPVHFSLSLSSSLSSSSPKISLPSLPPPPPLASLSSKPLIRADSHPRSQQHIIRIDQQRDKVEGIIKSMYDCMARFRPFQARQGLIVALRAQVWTSPSQHPKSLCTNPPQLGSDQVAKDSHGDSQTCVESLSQNPPARAD